MLVKNGRHQLEGPEQDLVDVANRRVGRSPEHMNLHTASPRRHGRRPLMPRHPAPGRGFDIKIVGEFCRTVVTSWR
jgi:hypothetical protein